MSVTSPAFVNASAAAIRSLSGLVLSESNVAVWAVSPAADATVSISSPPFNRSSNACAVVFKASFSSSDNVWDSPESSVVVYENKRYCILFCAASSSDTFSSTPASITVSILFEIVISSRTLATSSSSPDTTFFTSSELSSPNFAAASLIACCSSSVSATL